MEGSEARPTLLHIQWENEVLNAWSSGVDLEHFKFPQFKTKINGKSEKPFNEGSHKTRQRGVESLDQRWECKRKAKEREEKRNEWTTKRRGHAHVSNE